MPARGQETATTGIPMGDATPPSAASASAASPPSAGIAAAEGRAGKPVSATAVGAPP